jgi:hypothetical protein
MRITPHASNEEIISLVVVNAQNISISGGILHIQNRHMRLIRVSTNEPLADIFTKALPFPQFEKCLVLVGLMGGDLKPKGP